MTSRQGLIFRLVEWVLAEIEEGSSDRIILRGGGLSPPVVDRMGQEILDRYAVAADEQDPPG